MVVSLFKGKIFLDPRGVPCIYNFAKRKDFVFHQTYFSSKKHIDTTCSSLQLIMLNT